MVFEHLRLVHEPFDPRKVIEQTADYTISKGGVASFTGYVRANGGVEALELSHYEPLTYAGMEDIAVAAQQRFDLEAPRDGPPRRADAAGRADRPASPPPRAIAATRSRRSISAWTTSKKKKSAAWFWKARRNRDGAVATGSSRANKDHHDLARWNAN